MRNVMVGWSKPHIYRWPFRGWAWTTDRYLGLSTDEITKLSKFVEHMNRTWRKS